MVDDLLAQRGKGIVYAGDALPEETHLLVNYLNDLLGNSALYVTGTVCAGIRHQYARKISPPLLPI